MNIYKTSVNNPITTIILFVAIMIFGGVSLSRLGIDLFPDIESNAMMVMTTYPGASAEDIENNVTRPIENVLNGVDHLKDITSQSKENISIVSLEFEYGYDLDILANDVRDKLDMLSTLPDGVSQPIIFKFSSDIPSLRSFSNSAAQASQEHPGSRMSLYKNFALYHSLHVFSLQQILSL